jgi:3-oxoacyl-[acyl-carrier protein] reductase
MDLNLKGKVAIVTGGASGLGAAISDVLAAEGALVVVNYVVDEENTFKFVDSLNEKYTTKVIPLFGDITKASDVENVIARTIDIFGKIDILVNNAGTWPTAYVKDMTDEDWDKAIRINLTGPFLFSKRVVQHFLNRKSKGKIINIVSQAAFHGSTSGHAHYAAAKGGVVTFTYSLSKEVAADGITVNGVAPGMMRTPMNAKELADHEEDYIKRIPMRRISDPVEVAHSVAFLASDKADYITGTILNVTGGMVMR